MTILLKQFQQEGDLSIGVRLSLQETDKTRSATALQISFPQAGDAAKELAQLIDANITENGVYYCDLELNYNKETRVGIKPRSFLAMMSYLSLAVDVPECIEQSGAVELVCDGDGNAMNCGEFIHDLLHIRSSKCRPKEAYASTRYQGYWYYIDNRDVMSKKSFVLLLQLYNLQSIDNQKPGPVLTIPLGVR